LQMPSFGNVFFSGAGCGLRKQGKTK